MEELLHCIFTNKFKSEAHKISHEATWVELNSNEMKQELWKIQITGNVLVDAFVQKVSYIVLCSLLKNKISFIVMLSTVKKK